jgi:hypothetical protein
MPNESGTVFVAAAPHQASQQTLNDAKTRRMPAFSAQSDAEARVAQARPGTESRLPWQRFSITFENFSDPLSVSSMDLH